MDYRGAADASPTGANDGKRVGRCPQGAGCQDQFNARTMEY